MRRFYVLSFAMLLALSACAPAVRWRHPNLPESQWARDLAQCRRLAERDLGIDDRLASDERMGAQSGPMAEADRRYLRDKVEAAAGHCMMDRGYLRAAPSGK